jgi:hypothetical protein
MEQIEYYDNNMNCNVKIELIVAPYKNCPHAQLR